MLSCNFYVINIDISAFPLQYGCQRVIPAQKAFFYGYSLIIGRFGFFNEQKNFKTDKFKVLDTEEFLRIIEKK